jgi:hypothetical protein
LVDYVDRFQLKGVPPSSLSQQVLPHVQKLALQVPALLVLFREVERGKVAQ